MNRNQNISALAQYGLKKGFFQPCDRTFIINGLLEALKQDAYEPADFPSPPLEEILRELLDDAAARGVIENNITSRDLLDTKLMGILTPPPREVRTKFQELYSQSPETATDWFYQFSQDTDYIRRYRIQKDVRWKTATEYGNLDITINLSKPEKDPKGISVLELVNAFQKVNGIKLPYVIGPRRNGDLPAFWADTTKAKTLLDWEATHTVEVMCRNSWLFARNVSI